MKNFVASLLILGPLLLADAGITVHGVSDLNTSTAGIRTINLEEATDSILLVAISNEGNPKPNPVVTLDPTGLNIPFNFVAEAFLSQSYAGVFAIDLGDVNTGPIEFTISEGRGYTMIQLGGVSSLSLVSDTATTFGGSVSNEFTDLPPSSFVFSALTNRQQGNSFSSSSYETTDQIGANRYRQGYGYANGQSGSNTYTWNIANTGGNRPTALVSVAVIPEPTQFGLLTLWLTTTIYLVERKRSHLPNTNS